MSTCILVMGTVRSGTTATAGALHELGVVMYEKQWQSGPRINPKYQRYLNIAGYEPLERFGEPEWPKSSPPTGPKPTIGDARRLPTFQGAGRLPGPTVLPPT